MIKNAKKKSITGKECNFYTIALQVKGNDSFSTWVILHFFKNLASNKRKAIEVCEGLQVKMDVALTISSSFFLQHMLRRLNCSDTGRLRGKSSK